MKKLFPVLLVCSVVSAFLVMALRFIPLTGVIISSIGEGAVFETNDTQEYGAIKGNYDNKQPQQFIFSFFPTSLEDNFENVVYHYKAEREGTYVYEACLEFTIKDKKEYSKLVRSLVDENVCSNFSYDSTFFEYTVSNEYEIARCSQGNPPAFFVDEAKVGKILFSNSEQKIIFVAIGIHNGWGTETSELSYFFEKFSIEPIDFARTRDTGDG